VIVVLIVALALIGLAVALVTSAVLEPRIRRSENLSQIEAYGYTERAGADKPHKRQRATFDDLANWMGSPVSGSVLNIKEDEVQRELISAGFYRISARKFIGYRALLAIAIPIVLVWLFALADSAGVHRARRDRRVHRRLGRAELSHRLARPAVAAHRRSLPLMIDLLVVTLEAGVAFPQAPPGLASERIEGPLGDELRLTIQEQALGLSTL
jgi:Flp pilus assembly protein TadB